MKKYLLIGLISLSCANSYGVSTDINAVLPQEIVDTAKYSSNPDVQRCFRSLTTEIRCKTSREFREYCINRLDEIALIISAKLILEEYDIRKQDLGENTIPARTSTEILRDFKDRLGISNKNYRSYKI